MRRLSLLFAVLLAILMVGDVKADIVPLPARGAGLGNINAILIIGNNLTEESGCVSWNGSANIIGPAACPLGLGIPGGDERAAPLATKTVPIADLGVANAQSLRIVFNANESGGDSITLEKLVLTIYGATNGAVLFQGGIVLPIDYPTTDPGIGQLEGPLLQLNAPQAAAAQAAFSNTANRIGLAAQASQTSDGFENFFIISATPVPTMSTWLLMTLGTLLVGAGWMALRQRRLVMQQTPIR